jgi:alpha-beta hydrolase superfamily lysophospholipase
VTNEPTQQTMIVDEDGVGIWVYIWEPTARSLGVIHILHGIGEHARRYDRLAGALATAGYAVIADDHRGHGRTGKDANALNDLGPRGMLGALDAVGTVTEFARGRHGDLPVILLGHSWGSFLAQKAVERTGNRVDGLILSGSTLRVAEHIATGDLNARFAPARTSYDWLSRDRAEVDRYLADPLCGGLRLSALSNEDLDVLAGPPGSAVSRELPVLLVSGSEDPVGGQLGNEALAMAYRAVGLTDLEMRVHRGGRHEMFNETNRDAVTREVVGWLDHRFGRGEERDRLNAEASTFGAPREPGVEG